MSEGPMPNRYPKNRARRKNLLTQAQERAAESPLANLDAQKALKALMSNPDYRRFLGLWGAAVYNDGLRGDRAITRAHYETMQVIYGKYHESAMKVLIEDLEREAPYLKKRK